ncbi:Metallo-beta-lactamase superfamily protein [Favolaschia claudopus]|uniref:Metallo-beta-lactamase superfamily protein n=1 Tax=Favolaschia claudopus TaxID=2862362 RepID=A0AAW0BI43_9AGAR
MRMLSALSLVLVAGEAYAAGLDLGIPASQATVNVRVFNTANGTVVNNAHTLFTPNLPGRESVVVPIYSFLVEHSTRRFMFDLGIRTDVLNFAPSVAALFSGGIIAIDPHKDITELLEDGGIPLTSIDAVFWSHAHFDHIGDMSKFPNSTDLIIGSEMDTNTFPDFPNGTLQASDLEGRTVTKIDFSTANLTFSGLKAIDFFGDGSFYLVNTPGHLPGHMTALARVTPTSFISLGGDTFHHVGEARPRPFFQHNFPCPADLLEEARTAISTDFFWSALSREGNFDLPTRFQQLFAVSDLPDSFYADPVTSQVSLEKVARFDADPDILVLVAHDVSLRDTIPYFPAYLNDWKANGFKQANVWNFVNKTNPAFAFSPINNGTAS